MKTQLKDLEEQELEMDYWINKLHSGLQNTFLNAEDQNKYTYLTYEDFKTLNR